MIESVLSNIFNFRPEYNIILGSLSSILSFAIAYRANKLYTETYDKRLLIIMAGFILGGIFEMLHVISSYTQGIQFYYVIFRNLSYSGSIFISLHFNKSDTPHKNIKFKKNILIISIAYFFLVILLRNLISTEILEKSIPYASIEVIFGALYFLLAILYFDIRLDYKLKPVSMLVIGLSLLSLSVLYIITSEYYHSVYRLIIHIENLLGISLILLGIKEICLRKTPLNSRQNLLIYSSLILILFYWIMIFSGLIIFHIEFPFYFKYYIFLFFIFTVIIQYILSVKIVSPSTKPVKSIKSTFIITTLIIITTILILHSFISLYLFKTYTEAQTKNYLQSKIENESNKLYTQISNVETINQVSANSIKDFSINYLTPIIKANFRLNSFVFGGGVFLEPNEFKPGVKYYGLYWYKDYTGNIKFSSAYSSPEYNYFQYEWYKNGFIPNHKAVWSNPFIDIVTNRPLMSVTSPIYRNNKIVGVVETDVELFSFQNYVSKIKVGKEGYAFIVSDRGYYISNTDDKKILQDKITNDKNQYVRSIGEKIVNANKTGIDRTFINSIDSFVIYTPIGKTKLKMVFVLPAAEVYSYIYKRLIVNIALLFLSIILFSIIFTLLFSRLLVKPLDNLVETVGKVAEGNLSARASVKSKDEIAVFADSLNYMIESLENLVNKEKQNMEREVLLRNLISTIRSILDINEIKKTFVNEIGKFFKADRVVFAEFDPQKNIFLPTDQYSEYVSDPKIGSLIGYNWSLREVQPFIQPLKEQREINIVNLDNYIKEHNLENSDFEKLFKEWNIKSSYNILITYGNEILGFFCIDYLSNYFEIKNEDLELLRTITNQAGIAFHQAKLYETTKIQANREALLRKITETIRSSLNINETLDIISSEIAELFGADRVTISQTQKKYTKDIIKSEYLVREDIRGIKNVEEELFKIFEYLTRQTFPYDKALSLDNIAESDAPAFIKDFYKKLDVKSIIALPIKQENDNWGLLTLSYVDKYKSWKEEEKVTLKSIADQVYIAIKQAELYTNAKIQADREALLRKLVEVIRSSLDINETLNIICDEVARMFNVQRATIIQFPNLDNYEKYIIRREYKISPEIKGITDPEYHKKTAACWAEKTLQEDQKLFIDNIPESDTPDYFKKSYEAIGVKSVLGLPIKKGDDKWGTFVLSEYNYYRHWTEDEIQLLETISDQIYLALKQAELYTTTKEYADREKLIRETISIIRDSLDVEKIIHTFVCNLGKLFGASRSFFSKYDPQAKVFLTPDDNSEYRVSPEVRSYREFGENLETPYPFFSALTRPAKEPIIMSDREEFIKKYNLEGTNDAKSLREYNVAATVVVPILYSDRLIGMYVFDYDKPISFPQKDLDFVKVVSDQTAIALYQAELFTTTKEYADREAILRRIIEAVRSTMELDEIFNIVAQEIINLFKIQRVAIAKIDPYSQVTTLYREYRINENIKDSSSVPEFELVKEYWVKNLLTKSKTVVIDNISESDTPDYFKRIYSYLGVKSVIAVPIKSGEVIWGRMTLSEYNYYRKWSEKDISFLETIAGQVYTAIRQAELFSTTKQQAEKENSLRRIISKIGSSLDINEIKTTFVTEIGETLNSDLNVFYQINPDNNLYIPVDEYSVYTSSPDIKSLIGVNLEDYGYGEFYRKKEIETIIPNTKDFVSDFNLSGTPQEQFIKEFDIKSAIVVPVTYGEQLFGIFAINFVKDYRNITEDDVNFVRTLAGQAGIAIYQAKLYNKEKQTAEREILLRNIVSTIRGTLDINSIKTKIVNEIGKNLDIDICFILLYEPDENYFYIDEYSEYRSSPDEKTFVGYDTRSASVKYFIESFKQNKEINYSNVEEYISNNNLAGTEEEKFLQEFRIKSSYNIPIFYSDQLQGVIILEYTKKYKVLDENTLNFIRTLSDQAGIALYQAKLYNKEKQTAERESILRSISNKIRSSLDLEYVKHEIVNQIGILLKADRVAIGDYDPELNNYIVSKDAEYKSSDRIKTYIGVDFKNIPGFIENIRNIHIKGNDIIFSDLDKYLDKNNLRGTGVEKFYREFGFISSVAMNIYYGDIFLGDLVITFEHPRDFSDNEIKFLRTLADQSGVAIYQSKLYNKEKQTAERESLLRKVVETMRSSLDINEILTIICDEVGKLFNVERAAIIDLSNIKNYEEFEVRREYKVSPDIKGLSNVEYDKLAAAYWTEKTFEEFGTIAIDNISESDTPDYFKETYKALGVKSIIGVPIKKGHNVWGNFVLSEYNYYRHWTEDDIKLLETISDQVYIAIEQAELYTATKEYADREKTLREIITTVRSTLDINEIKTTFVDELGTLFNADRCFITDYNTNTGLFLPVEHSEYLSTPKVKSNLGDNLEEYKYYADSLRQKQEIIVQNAEEFIQQHHLKELPYKDYITEYEIKSGIGIPIVYRDQFLGILSVHFTTKYHYFTDEELDFVRTLANQAGIAIYQSKLYNSVKQTAEKEKLLREIISEIKIFQTFDQAYNYILEKMTEIFDVDRTIFVEIPTFLYERPTIKYEYIRNESLSPILGKEIPASCQQMFIEISKSLNISVINDIGEYYKETLEIQQFFRENHIKSFIAAPLAKYDKEIKFFGILVLCSTRERIWSTQEIELLKSIIESIITILWEISKFNEINELRNTFILTLAHDLQVPLVGEKRALEFLESRPDEQPIGKFREFITETLKSNQNLFNLLTRLLESYSYESGKKQLNLVEFNMGVAINLVVDKLKELAQSKSMEISVEIEKNLPNLKLDVDEIEEALYYLIENAITYTQPNGQIIIKSYKLQNEVITCISDNGPGIDSEIQERIFKRYEMAQAIERKIGSGLSLYLTKQIVEAHKGRIWYETEPGVGTIFCFVLPIQ